MISLVTPFMVNLWSTLDGGRPRARPARPFPRHTNLVEVVATAVLHDGRPIAVTGSDDHTVRIWGPHRWHPIGKPLTGHTDAVLAAAQS